MKRVKESGERVGFHLTEGLFAEFAEDVGDSASGAGFDLAIEIYETPAKALRKSHADGSFAGTHEPDEDDGTGLMSVAASDGLRLDDRSPRNHGAGLALTLPESVPQWNPVLPLLLFLDADCTTVRTELDRGST